MAALGRNIGMALGLSLATSLLYWDMSQQAGRRVTAYPHAQPHWFIQAMHFSYGWAVGLIGSAVLLLGGLLFYRGHIAEASR